MNQYKPDHISHPGETLREAIKIHWHSDYLFYHSLKTQFHYQVQSVLDGTGSIDEALAAELERILKLPSRYWLNRQRQYDECKD